MGDHGMRDSIRVVRRVIDWTREQYPDLPFVEFGHSWGSLMGQQIHALSPTIFDVVIWSGTTLLVPGIANTGNFNERWDGDGHGMSWLTRDTAEIKWMIDDRYGFDIGQSDMLDLPQVLGAFSVPPLLLTGRAARVPMYIVGGGEDPVSNSGRGAQALAWYYRHLSRMHDVTLRIYEGARHEVFNELNRADATRELIDWLDWHLVAPAELGS
jgi:alpha-beta hydrolase superfamily lysophospholipase